MADIVLENKNEINNKVRLDYLDIAKFIAIFLVILGHTTGNLDTPLYRVVLYAFHMPLFFMVSGVVIKQKPGEYNLNYWLTFLRKNVLALAVPYLIWALIYSQFSYNNILYILYGSWEALNKASTLTSLWFLPCMFVARIIVELFMMLGSHIKMSKHLYGLLAAIVCFAAGFLIPHPTEIGLPWCCDIAFVAAGFMLLGFAAKDKISELVKKPHWFHIIFAVVYLGLFICGILVQDGDPFLAIMAKASYGNIALFLANAFTGSAFLLSISVIITKIFDGHPNNVINRFMLWVGRSTIGIYLIHKNFLQEVCMKTLENLGCTLPNLGWALIGSLAAFIFSVILIFIIDRYVPQLFGKFPFKKVMVIKEEQVENDK